MTGRVCRTDWSIDIDSLRRDGGYERRQDTSGFVSVESTDIDAGGAHPQLHVQIVAAIREKVWECLNSGAVLLGLGSRRGSGDAT